jgi:DNA-binding response OmpR family regulator
MATMVQNPNRLNILVIDDDQEMSNLIKSYLNDQGHSVRTCTSPLQAIFLIQMQMGGMAPEIEPFSLIISDICMPDVNGYCIAQLSKSMLRDVSTILITAFGDQNHLREALDSGADDLIVKPFSLAALDLAVARVSQKAFEKANAA